MYRRPLSKSLQKSQMGWCFLFSTEFTFIKLNQGPFFIIALVNRGLSESANTSADDDTNMLV